MKTLRKLLVLTGASIVLGATALPAQAAGSWDYYWPCYRVLNIATSTTTTWTSNQRDAIEAAAIVWNTARVGSCEPFLQFFNVGPSQTWSSDCSMDADIIIEKVGDDYLPLGIKGLTEQQHNGLTHRMNCAHIEIAVFAADSFFGDESYWLAQNPEPVDRTGERGILVHELGHALGSGEWEDHGHTDYCSSYPTFTPGQFRTMCSATYVNSSTEPQDNVKVSLHADDVTAFNDSYPG